MERRVPIDAIRIENRHRKDFGDIDGLAESIASIGLIQPIVITDGNVLIAGERRVMACRRLGWDDVPATVAEHLIEAVDLLLAERDENTCRKDMTPSEMVTLGLRIEELERPKALERQHAHIGHRDDSGRITSDGTGTPTGSTSEKPPKTADAVGAALGISASNYVRARTLVQAAEAGDERAQEEVRRMDETGSITPAYNRWKGRDPAPSGSDREPDMAPDEAGLRKPPRRRQWDLISSGISALKGLGLGFTAVKEIDEDISRDQAVQLERELAESLRVLRSFHKKVKEYLNASHP